MAVECVKCQQKLDPGLTRCPGCGQSLTRPGAFMEVFGWVLMVISSIPLIIGEKMLEQNEYGPAVIGGAILALGLVLVIVGKTKARGSEVTTREPEAEADVG